MEQLIKILSKLKKNYSYSITDKPKSFIVKIYDIKDNYNIVLEKKYKKTDKVYINTFKKFIKRGA